MTTLSSDVLNYSLALGFLVLIGFLCYILYYTGKIVRDIHRLIEDIETLSYEVGEYTKNLRTGFLGIYKLFTTPKEVKKRGRKRKKRR